MSLKGDAGPWCPPASASWPPGAEQASVAVCSCHAGLGCPRPRAQPGDQARSLCGLGQHSPLQLLGVCHRVEADWRWGHRHEAAAVALLPTAQAGRGLIQGA